MDIYEELYLSKAWYVGGGLGRYSNDVEVIM